VAHWRILGDCIITTSLIRHLHSKGHQIFYVTSDRGFEVLKNNPHVFNLIKNDETVKNENLGEHIDWLKRKNHCDRVIDLNESIECALSQHPRSPNYKLPKAERLARFNRNFYEYCFEHAKEPWDKDTNFKPELFFDELELAEARKHLKDGFNLLVGLSGSGNNKAYPYIMDFCNLVQKEHKDVHFITVGDVKCQILEDAIDDVNVTKLAGNVPMRISMALTSIADLVIAPDTGIIHASGCYDTPKIALLGHTTRQMITKHFANDYSIEADEKLAPCAPCSYLVHSMKLQCPLNISTGSSICMADGIPLQSVYNQFKRVYDARLQEKG